jgi:light-regulated signal transduction histidine kinase (bacteriophytochrome)
MVINGFCDMITRKHAGGPDPAFVEQIRLIQESAGKMEQLIDSLLDYARLGKQALQRSPVHMNRLVESVVNELRPLYPEGKVTISPLARCTGDEKLLRQVFVNLISNAFKFTSRQAKRVIEIGCTKGPAETVFFVKDNGAGFDMQHKDRLFNVFQRLHAHDKFTGTGMGLAIVKKVVSLHGGTVWAEGRPGKGATFSFSIPH